MLCVCGGVSPRAPQDGKQSFPQVLALGGQISVHSGQQTEPWEWRLRKAQGGTRDISACRRRCVLMEKTTWFHRTRWECWKFPDINIKTHIMVKTSSSGWISSLSLLVAMRPLVGYTISPFLCFPICKIGVTIVLTTWSTLKIKKSKCGAQTESTRKWAFNEVLAFIIRTTFIENYRTRKHQERKIQRLKGIRPGS